ncbi:mitochondrial carrier [Hyaloraphidium curvatum]|nr:mitochondrial carrier [Hyaloraphidium curvatum]
MATEPAKAPRKEPSTLEGFVIGATAACMAVTVSNVPEMLKTRYQLLGEGGGGGNPTPAKSVELYRQPNPFRVLRTLYKHEGLRGIQRGLSAAYVYQIFLNGTRLGLFEPVRRSMLERGLSPYFASLVSGAVCGAVGAGVASPFFLLKTRMQSYSPTFPVGTQFPYVQKGLVHSFIQIYRTEGFGAIFKGAEVGVMRTAVGSAIQLSTYTTLKKVFETWGLGDDHSLANNLTSSLLTGFAVAAGMNPFDVIMSRVQNADPTHPYTSSWDCLKRTLRTEGVRALGKGYSAHVLRIGPHGVLTLVFMDQLRSVYFKVNS